MPEWIHRRFPERQMQRLELECSFPFRTNEYTYNVWERRDCKILLLGYLVHDNDCSNPLANSDGMGKIEDKFFMHHLGRDSGGEPMLDEQVAILARLHGVESQDFTCDTDTLEEMWKEARKQNKVGTPYAVALSFFDYEGYRESEERGHRWKIDAVWVPDKYLLEHLETFAPEKRMEEVRKTFDIALDEYNKWAVGDCWGVVVDIFERGTDGFYRLKENDACWGYIGDNYAKQELREGLLGWRKHLQRKPKIVT